MKGDSIYEVTIAKSTLDPTTTDICVGTVMRTHRRLRLNNAAPDMLAALKKADDALTDNGFTHKHMVIHTIRAAIAKAQGKGE